MDLTSFITAQRSNAVVAELATCIPARHKQTEPLETFSAVQRATEPREVKTDDAAMILLRYRDGARGMLSASRISRGRKGLLTWDIPGSRASAAWNAERPEER